MRCVVVARASALAAALAALVLAASRGLVVLKNTGVLRAVSDVWLRAYERSPRMRRASWMSARARGASSSVSRRRHRPRSSRCARSPARAPSLSLPRCAQRTLGHDRDALGVDGAEVRVLEEADEVGLGRLLQREHGRALEAQVRLELLRDLAHEALEGQLADQQLRRLLVAADLAQRDRARAVAVRLLDAARRRRVLARRLGGELLARGPASKERSGGQRATRAPAGRVAARPGRPEVNLG